MRLAFASVLALPLVALAMLPPPPKDSSPISIGGGATEWVTETKKRELREAGVDFVDVTRPQRAARANPPVPVEYPTLAAYSDNVMALFDQVSEDNLAQVVETLADYPNRYFDSGTGATAAEWMLDAVRWMLDAAGAMTNGATAEPWDHGYWRQNSVVATIPGKSNKVIVLGAHVDSITGWTLRLPHENDPAPGADDNASGCSTILEAMRILLTNSYIAGGLAEHTIEFHWYAAEEAGLYGSRDIFTQYAGQQERIIVAMLNQDMTGYTGGRRKEFGVVMDYTNDDLSDYTKLIIDAYCSVSWYEMDCGYACSDHASAYDQFIPASYVIEALRTGENPYMHTLDDTPEHLNYTHMHEHVKLCIAWVYELAFAPLDDFTLTSARVDW